MTRILKTLLTRKPKEPSPEEVAAMNYTAMALKVRVERIARQAVADYHLDAA